MMKTELERLKEDLAWQLTFEYIDWGYFIAVAERAREEQERTSGAQDE